ncbi:methyltransferase domain-containing protein [Methanoregula sp.]|uniref:class I SAM-dependent methyltransferase n=1 Tax=Methanoregula sp. TaxID=2052170 RepID=UPI002371C757|nr:methyltransferase domain-containing protein [Methanoregula sp.]MDD1686954.1 methyltransferase domain-containing protein [Methanoregula sp.]
MSENTYVHGYSPRESERLADQAQTLTNLLHDDIRYPAGSRVLEVGCGIGAQTAILAKNSPHALFTSIDISADSLKQAEETIRNDGITTVTFQQADIFHLPFEPAGFDHIFLCFVLEHLAEPERALEQLRPLLKDGGTITVIEGDHGSAFFHPENEDARRAVQCLVTLQQKMGGNALIGRELYPLLCSAGYLDVRVSPRMVYVDASRPTLVEGFTKMTFTAMVEGVGPAVLEQGLMSRDAWERGIAALNRTAGDDGVFCYTFFKATARK